MAVLSASAASSAPATTSATAAPSSAPASSDLRAAAALDDLGQAGSKLSALGAYQFRISLGGSLAKGGPLRGERLEVSGTVIPGIGRLIRFEASGRGAEPSVTYLERGSGAWLLLPTKRWLSVVPVDGEQPGTFTQYFPSAFYGTYDWPWIAGAKLLPRATSSSSTSTGTLSARSAGATRSYVIDPGTLIERASSAGFTAPVRWNMVVTVTRASGSLMAVEFNGQTTEAKGRINAFTESLVITPIRRATLPKPG